MHWLRFYGCDIVAAVLFVARLILFDTYILQSIWLEDVILLQHSFGPAGLSRLLDSAALKFQCPDFTFGQTGQGRSVFTPEGQPPLPALPFFNYQFSVIRVQNAEEKLERTLATLNSGLREQLIKNRILIPEDYSKTVFEAFYRDLTTEVLDSSVKMELRRRGIVPRDCVPDIHDPK